MVEEFQGLKVFERIEEDELEAIVDFFFEIRKAHSPIWNWEGLGRNEWWKINDNYEDGAATSEEYGPFMIENTAAYTVEPADHTRIIFSAHDFPIDQNSETGKEDTIDIAIFDGMDAGDCAVTYIDFYLGAIHEIIPFIVWGYKEDELASLKELSIPFLLPFRAWKRHWKGCRMEPGDGDITFFEGSMLKI